MKFDYIKSADELLGRFYQVNALQFQSLLEKLPEDYGCCLYAIDYYCKDVAASIGVLLRQRQFGCVHILLRTLINASAKFCYLMHKDEETRNCRLRKYIELATKKDFASMEQPVRNLFKNGAYGTGEKLVFAKQEFLIPTMERKTKEGEGHEVKAATNDLDYWFLTKALSDEFWYWKEIGHSVDFDYAAANKHVHVNYTACEEIMRRYARIASGTHGELEDTASGTHMLFEACVMARARSERIFDAMGGNPSEMRKILCKEHPFVAFTDQVCLQASEKVMKERQE